MEEAEMLLEPAADAYHIDGTGPVLAGGLYREVETEPFETVGGVFDDWVIRVRDAQDTAAVTTLCIEYAREVPFAPGLGGDRGPGDDLPNALDVPASTGTDRLHRSLASDGLLEGEATRSHSETQQVFARTPERLLINERPPEPMLVPVNPPGTSVRVGGQVPIPAHEPAQVASSIISISRRRHRETTGTHQLVIGRQVRSLASPLHRADHELPAPIGQETMISTTDEARSVAQSDAVGWLLHAPMVQHSRLRVPSIHTAPDCSEDLVPNPNVFQPSCGSIRHEDRCVAR